MPSEYARDTAFVRGRFVRLGGLVEPGSVKYDEEHLHSPSSSPTVATYPVQYDALRQTCSRERWRGHRGRFHDGVFEGDNLLVKHSNDYHPPKEGEVMDVEALKESLR